MQEIFPKMEEKTQNLKEKQAMQLPRDHHHLRSSTDEVKLAATAISLNVRLRSSDMPPHIQERALRCTGSLLQSTPKSSRPNPTHLARTLKKEFDSAYGPAWHCVVGASFGSFVTHSPGGFVYFSVDSLSVLLFKTEVRLVIEPEKG
ncbi:hypothetical protein UlMin_022569 [Ulmus minor]